MQDKLEDNQEDYCSLTNEDWFDLLSKIEVKDNRKSEANQIKNISSARVASHSDSNKSVRIPSKKKTSTGVLLKNLKRKASKHHGTQRHFVIHKKAGITERKYMLHSSEDCFGKRSDQNPIRDGLGEPMGIRDEYIKQWNKSKNKCKKELKTLKN